jgi:hypothetical protein
VVQKLRTVTESSISSSVGYFVFFVFYLFVFIASLFESFLNLNSRVPETLAM